MIQTDSYARAAGSAGLFAKVALVLSAIAVSTACSAVFTASIDGTILDAGEFADGNTVGITNATVWLYTDRASRDADFASWVDGDLATLPSASGRGTYRYFLSTMTDDGGNYQFAGVIWETFSSEFGKTADRSEVWLLAWHPDYGLWTHPSPLYVVSDVSNQFEPFTMESIWSTATLAGKTLNWKDGKPLANVPIQVRVPSSWSYAEGEPVDPDWAKSSLFTATTGDDGTWSLELRFARQPGHTDLVHRGLARVSWSREGWRAGDPALDPASPLNSGVLGDADIDLDGSTAIQGDGNDWFRLVASFGPDELVQTGAVSLQRHEFQASLSGTVKDSGTGEGLNGVELVLSVAGLERSVTYSAATDTANGTVDGRFDFGTISWTLDDIASDEASRKAGVLVVSLSALREDGSAYTIDSTPLTELKPDVSRSLELSVTTP